MAVGWPTKINFTNGNVLGATDLNDLSGTVNSLVDTTNYPNQLSFITGATRRPLPFAMQAGTATITISAAASGSASVTLLTGRFSATPIINVTNAGGTSATAWYLSTNTQSSTGFTVRADHRDGTSASATINVDWTAFQMKSATAAG